MKALLTLSALLVSFSSFGATLTCKIDMYNSGSKVETLEINSEVSSVGGNSKFLSSYNKRYLFQIGATSYEVVTPQILSTRLTIHVTDANNRTRSSLTASFNNTDNSFRFEGGDLDGTNSYVGRCSIENL